MISTTKLDIAYEELARSNSLDELQHTLENMPKIFGLANVAYHAIHLPGYCTSNPIILLTYHQEWVTRYIANDYFSIDPVVSTGTAGFLPLDWTSVDASSAAAVHFFREAWRHEVGRQGFTIPIRGPGGERALFSVTSHASDDEWKSNKYEYMRDFHLLGHLVHDRAVTFSGYRSSEQRPQLSRRERECLQEILNGKTPKQIASDLSLSMSAIRLYLQSARMKIGAKSIAQAAVMFLETTLL